MCPCVQARAKRHPTLPTIFNQSIAALFPAQLMFSFLILACWLFLSRHVLVPHQTSVSPNIVFPLFSPSACSSSLLCWGAHHQKLPSHGPRRPAQRAARGWTHRRSVPGCHVHPSQTGHAHSHQQPPAGSAHPQCLKITSLPRRSTFYPKSCWYCERLT